MDYDYHSNGDVPDYEVIYLCGWSVVGVSGGHGSLSLSSFSYDLDFFPNIFLSFGGLWSFRVHDWFFNL